MRIGSLYQFGPVVRALIVGGIAVWAIFTIFPFYWTFVTSFKNLRIIVGGPTYFPFIDFQPTVFGWRELFGDDRRPALIRNMSNSAYVAVSAALVATLFGTMAAYALARYKFKTPLLAGLVFAIIAIGGYVLLFELGLKRFHAIGIAFFVALVVSIVLGNMKLPGPQLANDDIVFWFVSQRMFPPIVSAFALFLLYSEFGRAGFKLTDTYLGLTLCYTAFSLPIVIWLMRDFFDAVPIEIEEAAMIDDVPVWRIFVQIVVPTVMPGLIATFMITLAFVWNEYLFALFLTNTKWQTLPILVASQISQRGDEWWALSTASLMAILPMVLVVWVLGRLMKSGMLLGSIK